MCGLALLASAALLVRAFAKRRIYLVDFSVYQPPERCEREPLAARSPGGGADRAVSGVTP